MSRWLFSVLACCCAGLVVAAPAVARGHLDRSFGEGGAVFVAEDLAPGWSVGQMETAPDDSVFFTREHWDCSRSDCWVAVRLLRYRPDGRLDRGFGERAGALATHRAGGGSLAVDRAGRVLYSWKAKEGVVKVRRLRRDGTRDRSFGQAGTVELRCDCWLGRVSGLPGGGLLVSGFNELDEDADGLRGARWFFARLRGDGSPDRRFGGDGVVRLRMRGYASTGFDPAPGGGLALGGDLWTLGEDSPPFVSRLSARGQLDRRYTARATRSLRGVHGTRRDGYPWLWSAVFARPRGKVLVYADAYENGVAVRLLRDGSRDRSFGDGGIRVLPLAHSGAAVDAAGGTIAVGYVRRLRKFGVVRLRPDGRTDRKFGVVRFGGFGEDPPVVNALANGGAIVFDSGYGFCRGECPPPSAVMYKVLP